MFCFFCRGMSLPRIQPKKYLVNYRYIIIINRYILNRFTNVYFWASLLFGISCRFDERNMTTGRFIVLCFLDREIRFSFWGWQQNQSAVWPSTWFKGLYRMLGNFIWRYAPKSKHRYQTWWFLKCTKPASNMASFWGIHVSFSGGPIRKIKHITYYFWYL